MFSGLSVDTYGCTDRGKKRDENEDHFLIAELHRIAEVTKTSLPALDHSKLMSGVRGLLLMVADGLGGKVAGEHASRLALQTILDYATNSMRSFYRFDQNHKDDLLHELAMSALLSHQKLVQEGTTNPDLKGMETSLTKVHILWPTAYIVQVGSSRCYLLRKGKIERLTKDQTVAQYLMDAGTLNKEEAKTTRWRHVLTQSLGKTGKEIAPTLSTVSLKKGDSLLLCTDGLTRHLPDDRISELAHASTARFACEALMGAALASGGKDNITVVVSRFNALE